MRRLAEHRRGSGFTLIDGILHGFQADQLPISRAGEQGDIARRINSGRGSAGRRVDENAVRGGNPGLGGKLLVRNRANRDENGVRIEPPAIREAHGFGGSFAFDSLDSRSGQDLDPLGAVLRGQKLGEGRRDAPREHALLALHDRHHGAELARLCRNLQADIAAANDDQPCARLKRFAEPLRIVDAADGVHALRGPPPEWECALPARPWR